MQAYIVSIMKLGQWANAPRTSAPGEISHRTSAPSDKAPLPCLMYRTNRENFQECQRSPLSVYIPLTCDVWARPNCCLLETKLHSHNNVLICLCRTHKLYSVVHHGALYSSMKCLSCLTSSNAVLASRDKYCTVTLMRWYLQETHQMMR